jgi:N-acetylglucosamine-6-phosphate deacetylase
VSSEPLVVAGGSVIGPGAVIEHGDVVVRDGRIVAVGASGDVGSSPDTVVLDATGCWVAPGFIDVQLNGGHGIDLTTEPDRAGELGGYLPRYGVTSFVPTIITCDDVQRAAALTWWGQRDGSASGAVALGLHLEGPMLSPARRGAHPAGLLRDPEPALINGWDPASGVLLATLAPELPGAVDSPPVASSCPSATPTAPPTSSPPASKPEPRTSPTCSTRCGRSPTAIRGRSAPLSPTTRWWPV